MRHASNWLVLLLASVVFASDVRADDAPSRSTMEAQIAAEAQVIDTARTAVDAKLSQADAIRAARVRAAYRLLRAPLRSNATAGDRIAAARRRAAAHLLLARDRSERALLADEAQRLTAAREQTVVASRKLPELTLPTGIAWPAKGEIARRFGTLSHERSKTTLARRGIDLEVEQKATASAPAAGTVRYAGPIRGLDRGLIIDHGDYYTVIAKLGELAVPAGAVVSAGDKLGRAARHRIYLELRVKIGPGGLPIDPEPLLGRDPGDPR